MYLQKGTKCACLYVHKALQGKTAQCLSSCMPDKMSKCPNISLIWSVDRGTRIEIRLNEQFRDLRRGHDEIVMKSVQISDHIICLFLHFSAVGAAAMTNKPNPLDWHLSLNWLEITEENSRQLISTFLPVWCSWGMLGLKDRHMNTLIMCKSSLLLSL